jgi:hypothetical protein
MIAIGLFLAMKDSILMILVLPMHSFMSEREQPSLLIRFPAPILAPGKRGEATEYISELRFHKSEGVWLVFAIPMKVIGLEAVSAPLRDQLEGVVRGFKALIYYLNVSEALD